MTPASLAPDNPASPEFVHMHGPRFRILRATAEEVVDSWERLARSRGLPQSFRRITQGSTVGGYGTERFARECLDIPHLKRVQVTWNARGTRAYLVLIGLVDHLAVARHMVEFCYDNCEPVLHNMASLELAMTIERPPDLVIDRILGRRQRRKRSSGPIRELFVLQRRLRVSARHSVEVTLRCYERIGDPNEGVCKLEISTTRYGDEDPGGKLLDASSTVGLRALLLAAHQELQRLVRKHDLRPVPMPLTYMGLPIIWQRCKRTNLKAVKGRAAARGLPVSPAPVGMPEGGDSTPGREMQGSSEAALEITDGVAVTEAGVPIYIDDDDGTILARFARYIPIQKSRYESTWQVDPEKLPFVIRSGFKKPATADDGSDASADGESSRRSTQVISDTSARGVSAPSSRSSATTLDEEPPAPRPRRRPRQCLVVAGERLPPLPRRDRLHSRGGFNVRVERCALEAAFDPTTNSCDFVLRMRFRVTSGRHVGKVLPWCIREGEGPKLRTLLGGVGARLPPGGDVDVVLPAALLDAPMYIEVDQLEPHQLFIKDARPHAGPAAATHRVRPIPAGFTSLRDARRALLGTADGRATLPRVHGSASLSTCAPDGGQA